MGYRIKIVFDLKTNHSIAKNILKKIVKKRFDQFSAEIRKSPELDIRLEEEEY